MVNFPVNWSEIDKINNLQRRILLNSIMYYIYDKSYISDYFYDSMCKQLVQLQDEYGDSFVRDSMYGYAFHDFDGSTGYHLFSRLTKYDKDHLRDVCTWKALSE